jgi:hypothetical protein
MFDCPLIEGSQALLHEDSELSKLKHYNYALAYTE